MLMMNPLVLRYRLEHQGHMQLQQNFFLGILPFFCSFMAASLILLARRALVSVLLSLATAYHLAITVDRDSDDQVVVKAYKRVLLKAHPDKGGRKVDMQHLQDLC